MAEFIFDKTKVAKALMDVPITPPCGISAEEAMTKPGNCVKSIAHERNGCPKWFGRIVTHSPEEVVIVSHAGDSPFLWTGTGVEYHRTWLCD